MDTLPFAEKLPARIGRLGELAYNFWWSWHREARDLFKMLDYPLWRNTGHNPVQMLIEVTDQRLEQVAADPAFRRHYEAVLMDFDRDMRNGHLWFPAVYPDLVERPIAYFSAEFGVHQSLPIYSGGLGVLAGDHCKEASDLGIPLVGVGFLYELGYFRQRIPSHGWQEAIYPRLNVEGVALQRVWRDDDERLAVSVHLVDRDVRLEVFQVNVGRVKLFLMDANTESNAPWDRELTARLYGGDQELRIQQEIVLGIGGVRVLRALGLEPAVWHMNEGHSAFLVLERARELVSQGASFEEAMEAVRATSVFTTHTPVPAGHDAFPFHLMDKYFQHFWGQLGLDRDRFMQLGSHHESWGDAYNMTALAMRSAGQINAVSKLHAEVSRRMWQSIWPEKSVDEVPIPAITNGIHVPSWVGEAMNKVYNKHVAPNWVERQDDATIWQRLDDVPDAELWSARQHLKRKLMSLIRERARDRRIIGQMDPEQVLVSGTFLDPEALIIGFARRVATYKRATLLFRNIDRLKRLLLNPYRPVQIIFAGKAHPADEPAKHLIQYIYNTAKDPGLGGRVAFLEDYDMHVARYMVQGVDVWLNTPRPLMEASGTSGQKAAINGILNLSIPDGWWAEGYEGDNGWSIGRGLQYDSPEAQDAADEEALYSLLEEEVVPLYYKRDSDDVPRDWLRLVRASIRSSMPIFSTRRMVKDYANQMYEPAAREALERQF